MPEGGAISQRTFIYLCPEEFSNAEFRLPNVFALAAPVKED